MDLSSLDWLWKAAVVQLLLEAVFALVAIRIVCKAVAAKPKATLASLGLSWTLWLIANLLFHRGRAWKELRCRCVAAADASMHFVVVAWEVSSKWSELFIPFMRDVGGQAFSLWRGLPAWQQAARVALLVLLYVAVRAFRAAKRVARVQGEKAKKSITSGASFLAVWTPILMGQTLFIAAVPFLWIATSWITEEWLPLSLLCALRYIPMFLSLLSLDARGKWRSGQPSTTASSTASGSGVLQKTRSSSAAESAALQDPRSAGRPSRTSFLLRSLPGFGYLFSISSLLSGDRWLSFWACWPALTLLEACSSRIALAPGMPDGTQQRRALLIVVLWVWYCGRAGLWLYNIFSFMLHCVAAAPWVKLSAKLMTTGRGISVFGLARWLQQMWDRVRQYRRLGYAFAILAGTALLVIGWSFYQAFRIFSGVLKMGIWAVSAGDTARALHQRQESRYPRLLAFWITTLVWDALTSLTAIGSVVELFTPAAFSLALVAPGEVALSWGVRVVKDRLGCRGAHEKAE